LIDVRRRGAHAGKVLKLLQNKEYAQRDDRDVKGVGDRWSEMQEVNMHDIG
jgi:hypothetical protein